MNRKNEIKKELEEISPLLSELEKEKSGFRVPDNYFKEMQNEVFLNLRTAPETEKPAPSFIQKIITESLRTLELLTQPRYALRLAGFALIVTVGVIIFQKLGNPVEQEYLVGISAEDAMDYVTANIDDFEFEDVLEVAQVSPDELYAIPESSDELIEEYIDEIIDDFEIEELEEML